MKNMKTLLVTSVLLTSTVMACTKREVPVTQHEGPRQSDEVVFAPASEKIDVEALKAINAPSLNAKLSNAGSGDKLAALKALAPFVLDRTYVENERVTSSRQMREALTVYLRALVGDAKVEGLAQQDPRRQPSGSNARGSSSSLVAMVLARAVLRPFSDFSNKTSALPR